MTKASLPLVQATHVHKRVHSGQSELTILEDINLTIHTSQTVAILGSSGSGKTTLLSLLSGLDLPTSGDIMLDGQNISLLSEDARAQIRNNNIGIIFQTFQLIPSLTALENVLMPLELAGITNANSIAHQWLKDVGLAQREHHYPAELSGGEQQRVAIARAFAISPKILFADEPTGNLDQNTGQQVIELLHKLNQQYGTTLVIVTHDQQLATSCQQHYQLEDGCLS